ncbi:MAG: 2-hydroxyacyl-CoA dehydratase [bacterium JZ-2024 1]
MVGRDNVLTVGERVGELSEILDECVAIVKDNQFSSVRAYRERTGKKVIGYFPVYTPVELIDAAGALPVGLHGGGNEIEITHADALFGSFICSIVKSTMELFLKGSLSFLDGMFFSGICDSARNLCFVVQRHFPEKAIHFLHFPQNVESPSALPFLIGEYGRVKTLLEQLTGNPITDDSLNQSISRFNRNRQLISSLYEFRKEHPEKLATWELYVLMRVGNFLPVEEHNRLLWGVRELLEHRPPVIRDRIRVVVEGAFCEQPPVEMLKLLDDVGCHILDDDFVLGKHFLRGDVELTSHPLEALGKSYLNDARTSSVRYSGKNQRVEHFVQKIKNLRVDAVIFLYAKFCEPGLFDYVLYKDRLRKEGIPHLFLEFEEKMWTFDRVKLELETFVESLIFA